MSFNCAPEKYYKMGERPISVSNGQLISNPTLFPAKPFLTITGTGAGRLYFGSNYLDISDIGGSVTIDIREHKAYHGSQNRNGTITGLFENMVLAGKMTVRWTGGISSVTMIPRWWTI